MTLKNQVAITIAYKKQKNKDKQARDKILSKVVLCTTTKT